MGSTRKQRSGETTDALVPLRATHQGELNGCKLSTDIPSHPGPDLRADCRGLWHMGQRLDPFQRPGQCPHAGDRSRHSGRRCRLPRQTVQDHCHGGRRARHLDRRFSGWHHGRRFCAGRRALGCLRLHRHECVRARQCAHRAGSHTRHRPRAGCRVSRRRHHRHAGGGTGAAGRDGLLLVSGGQRQPHAHGQPRYAAQPAHRLCLRVIADFDFCAAGRRHLHQGGGCRRRSGGQGRGRHP